MDKRRHQIFSLGGPEPPDWRSTCRHPRTTSEWQKGGKNSADTASPIPRESRNIRPNGGLPIQTRFKRISCLLARTRSTPMW